MTKLQKLQNRITGFYNAIARYPLTALFLLAAAVINAIDISTDGDYIKYLLACIVGAFLSAVFQVAYERFAVKNFVRKLLMVIAVLMAGSYYLIIRGAPELSMEIEIRTAVALFALLIAFIWVPVIKSRISFNESFMAAFKALFIAAFFAGVIFGGVRLILAAINHLLFTLPYTSYSHMANLIFVIFAPMYFLSLIPVYPRKASESGSLALTEQQEEKIVRASSCPKFLEILISYIIIPLVAVFTVILLIYIVLNIGSKFWTDNLLEPMLISYAITVILVYILASRLENKFALWFRKIFPKVLVPIVIFQIVSSIISLGDTGLTHTRYYVILFGIFAVASGIILSFMPVRKNGIIAAMLIAFALVSIIPPVDAFTLSHANQINMLENVLIKNNMLENNTVKPNAAIPNADKQKITQAVYYLERMNYIDEVECLPNDFKTYTDFYKTFGFNEYEEPGNMGESVYVSLNQEATVDITGYDSFIYTHIAKDGTNDYEGEKSNNIYAFAKAGKNYTLQKDITKTKYDIKLLDENNKELLSFATTDIFEKFVDFSINKNMISVDEAALVKENDAAKIMVIVQNLNMDKYYSGADVYIFIKIK
ncbi:MAG: DUF4153 domain-containing protein [Clostridia bacterium]|nr:DUF4153 domain-containing protein [Clostridia bacterium]